MSSSVTMDEALLRRMARDAATYSLTRPLALGMWVLLVAALATAIVNATARGSDAGTLAPLMPVLVVALAGFAVLASISGARNAVRHAMPPGTVVCAETDPHALTVGSGKRISTMPYDEFRRISAGRAALLLKLRGMAAVSAVPRALFTDEQIGELRAKIG
ncbi:YcxB family protein [Microbacterium sp.]|uniref:YcxB family protein n=1 Tax=Microbacterium sp. TaxID=51671 RepID=UPI0039E29564